MFFEENPNDQTADEYVANQEPWQQKQLKVFVTELETAGTINHRDAGNIGNGRWSLWVRTEGQDAVNHVCYLAKEAKSSLSDFAKSILDINGPSKNSNPSGSLQRELVIVSEDGRPGERSPDSYVTIDFFASTMDAITAGALLEVLSSIRSGAPSPHYTPTRGGRFNIHIDRPELAYGVHLKCVARWV